MKTIEEDLLILRDIYEGQMEKYALVKSYKEASEFQIKLNEIDNTLLMIKNLKNEH